MCRFLTSAKKVFSFTAVFLLSAGSACFPQEVKLSTIMPSQETLRGDQAAVGENYRDYPVTNPGGGGPFIGADNLIVEGSIGAGTTNPQAKIHIGGTAGTDGIMFPDGTLQTTACGNLWANPLLQTPVWNLIATGQRYGAGHEFLIKYSFSPGQPVKQIKLVVTARNRNDWPDVGYTFYLKPPTFFDGWEHVDKNNWIQFIVQNHGDGNFSLVGWGADSSADDGWIDVDTYFSYD